jgi:hypothetical protein
MRLEGTMLEIEADIADSSTMGGKKVRALSRRFELAGAMLNVDDSSPWRCTIGCDRREGSSFPSDDVKRWY